MQPRMRFSSMKSKQRVLQANEDQIKAGASKLVQKDEHGYQQQL